MQISFKILQKKEFFSKKSNTNSVAEKISDNDRSNTNDTTQQQSLKVSTTSNELFSSPSEIDNRSDRTDEFDISFYINKMLSEDDRVKILTKIWKPSGNFDFPKMLVGKQSRQWDLS